MAGNVPRKRILIVDDARANIDVLVEALKNDYELGIATSGLKALRYLEKILPHLILLDIVMPDMDGYEVCARLKGDKRTKDIPIIFITAMDEITEKTKGFHSGAVDYITKPFEVQEVLVRVKTHMTLREYATRLEQMVEERTRQLIHSDRLATLGTFAAAIVHEINNPNALVSGNTELLQLFWETGKPIMMRHSSEDETGWVGKTADKVDEMLKNIYEGSRRISLIANRLRAYARQSDVQRENCSLADIVDDALHLVAYRLKYDVEVEVSVPSDARIFCDSQRISQVFVNLLNNALDAVLKKPIKLAITATAEKDRVSIRIRDNGPGIPDEKAVRVFDPFFTTKSKDKGTGLGLFIVRSIIEEHQGEISLSSFDGNGAEFNISLPCLPVDEAMK